jgi:hypothetical protein
MVVTSLNNSMSSSTTYSWGDNVPDPSTYERHAYHWHLTEGEKEMVRVWVEEHNYSDMFIQADAPDKFWAYPPGGMCPVPIEMSRVIEWYRNRE